MIASAVLAIALGIYLGEEIGALWPASFFAAMIGFLTLGVLLTPGSVGSRIVGGIILLLPLISGFVAGRYEATTAFQESVDRAPVVQEALAAHKVATGDFPESLEQLEAIELPGRRLIRDRVLRYRKTAAGYQLVVERWELRFDGDEETPLAHRPAGD